MKKVLSILCVFLLIISLFTTKDIFAKSTVSSRKILPSIEKVKEKKKFKDITSFKDKPDELKKYLDNLNEQDLLLAIAECAEELEKHDAISELMVFTQIVDKKLINKLETEDYAASINYPEYSDTFRLFMIDTYRYSKQKNKEKNNEKINNELKKLVKDKKQSESLRFNALKNIDNLSKNDLTILEDIMSEEGDYGHLKATALEAYNSIDHIKGYKAIRNILSNHNTFTQREVVTAMRLLTKVSTETLKAVVETDTAVSSIEDIIKASKNRYIIEGAVFALGNIRKESSVKAIIDNKDKINDNSLISFYVDMNYTTVNNMLSKENKSDVIKLALECIEVAPFRDFLPQLQILIQEYPENEVKDKVNLLTRKINENTLVRTTKWDDNK